MSYLIEDKEQFQRFYFSVPQFKRFKEHGERWVVRVYFEQDGAVVKPLEILPPFRDPSKKTEYEAAASAFYDLLPMISPLTMPGWKQEFLFHDRKVIDVILSSESIVERMHQFLEIGNYEFSIVQKTPSQEKDDVCERDS